MKVTMENNNLVALLVEAAAHGIVSGQDGTAMESTPRGIAGTLYMLAKKNGDIEDASHVGQ